MTLTPPFFRRTFFAIFCIAITAVSTGAAAQNHPKNTPTKKAATPISTQAPALRTKAVQGSTPYAERVDAMQFADDLA